MTQVTYQVDRRFPIAVLRLRGALTTGDGPRIAAAITESLLEEPSSVIVDLAGLTAADEEAAVALPRIAAQAAHWPGSTLRLCNLPASLAPVVQRSALLDGSTGVSLHRDFAAALAAAAADPMPLRMHQRLEPTVLAPRAARELAADSCTEWGLPGYLIPAEIIASELVTNAVRHAGTVMDLRITLHGRRLRVSVHDRITQRARLKTTTSADNHGRGLLIVSSIAADWGSEPMIGGKVVWASLKIAPDPPSASGVRSPLVPRPVAPPVDQAQEPTPQGSPGGLAPW